MSYEQYSSFQIGKMLNVSRQAVNQWIDKGYIISYRTPGGHRRVRRDDLMNFLKTRNIPVPPSLQGGPEGDEEAMVQPTVMLVDDEVDYLSLLEHALLEQIPEVEIIKFSNGYDALVAIGNAPPDLLVLDLEMPSMDGIEICKRLSENPLTGNVTVSILTAHDTPQWRDSLRAFKVETFLTKSMPINEIAGRLAEVIRRKTAAGR